MTSIRTTLRRTRDRLVEPVVDRTASRTAADMSDRLLAETAELRRILANQGDAADEVAETLGRALTRLSAEVSSLTAELARLNERLDILEKR